MIDLYLNRCIAYYNFSTDIDDFFFAKVLIIFHWTIIGQIRHSLHHDHGT